jgi:hypothetical protein
MLDRIGSTGQDRQVKERSLEQALDVASRPPYLEGGRWAVLISFVALVFSGISLYETILKQPRPVLHVGGIMHYARDPVSGADVFAVPVTLANQGARDAVVTTLDLRIVDTKAAAPVVASFASAYVGSNPAKENQPFTPLAIPGRNSYAGVILFYPSDLKNGAAKAVVDGMQRYRFCLSVRTEDNRDYPLLDAWLASPPAALSFDAELLWFSVPELLNGKTIPMQIDNVQRHGQPRRDGERTASGCD